MGSPLLVSETVPALIRVLPGPVAQLLATAVLGVDSRRSGPYAPFRDLLPGIRFDFHVVGGVEGKMETFASIDKPMLLLSGTKRPRPSAAEHSCAREFLPDARHVEFDGLGQSGSWNTGRGGRPGVVAAALREFFA